MTVATQELLQYHPELLALIPANLILPLFALVLRNKMVQLLALVCLLISALDILKVSRFERDWAAQMAEMHEQFEAGNRATSLGIARHLLEIARAAFPEDSPRVVEGVHHVGWLLVHNDRAPEAEPFFKESLTGYEHLDPALPNDHDLVCTHGVGNERSLLAYVFEKTGRRDLADQFYQDALAHYRARCPKFPQYQTEMLNALENLHRTVAGQLKH
ncbi:MAG: hypothetical protein U0136_09210 [Bdellovibrionota bacterium]